MLNISIKAEPIFQILGFSITNSFLASIIVLIILFALANYYKQQTVQLKKSSFFYIIQGFIKEIYKLFEGVLGTNAAAFFPLVGAFFFFILVQNWFGLLPGVGSVLISGHENSKNVMVPLLRGASADLNVTLALGIVAVIAIQIYGIKYIGIKQHLKKYITPKSFFLLGILELISEVSRIVSFSFRLFGNVFAGEVLLLVIAFLIPVFISFPFFIMEVFVGFIQALVFSMLVSVFLSMAVTKHH